MNIRKFIKKEVQKQAVFILSEMSNQKDDFKYFNDIAKIRLNIRPRFYYDEWVDGIEPVTILDKTMEHINNHLSTKFGLICVYDQNSFDTDDIKNFVDKLIDYYNNDGGEKQLPSKTDFSMEVVVNDESEYEDGIITFKTPNAKINGWLKVGFEETAQSYGDDSWFTVWVNEIVLHPDARDYFNTTGYGDEI